MINTREEIRDFIISLEKNFPVNDWKINKVHIWPFLRINLFFHLINNDSTLNNISVETQKVKRVSVYRKLLYKNKRLLLNTYKAFKVCFKFFSKLSRKKYLFLGADTFRVNYKGKRYNRYFDVLIDEYGIKGESLCFEYDLSLIKNQYNAEIVSKFNEGLKAFSFLSVLFNKNRISQINLNKYSDFINYLSGLSSTKKFSELYSETEIFLWGREKFIPKFLFFNKVLKKINPEKIIILCYYSEDIMALTAAASYLGIETIEMQHGPQNSLHLAYGSWTIVPDKGYDMLPKTFWCWNDYSRKALDEWGEKISLYKSQVIGNPWVDYWQTKRENYSYNNYILYSLQPAPLTLEELFPDNLIDLIKEEGTTWFIRLHPRQQNEVSKIRQYLKGKKVLDVVNIEQATNDPLPQLLANTIMHVTHFSGTTIEASLFGKKTVLLNKIALKSFPNLIKNKNAIYLNIEAKDFSEKMLNIIEKVRNEPISKTFNSHINNLFD